MRNERTRSLILLSLLMLLLPLTAQALTPVGAPLVIVDESPCSFVHYLEVIATPKGAFEAVWVDGNVEEVKGRRFGRDLVASGPPVTLLPMHGGLDLVDIVGAWAGRYEVAINVLDFGTDPSDPEAAYRVSLDLEGDPLAPPARFETQRFQEIAPAAGGDSLQFRWEPPFFGTTPCLSRGILASRIGPSGAPLSSESRVTRRASAWGVDGPLEVVRLPNDIFVAAYSTCEKFRGVVARRLNPVGVPVGKPINLPFPAPASGLVVAARGNGNDLAVAAVIFSSRNLGINGVYTRTVTNGKVSDLHRIPIPAGLLGISELMDLEASSTGSGYLLLFRGANSERQAVFAQELNAQGAPQGAPLNLAENGVSGAIASLPDGRWLAVTRAQTGTPEACTERLIGTVLSGE